MQSKLGGKMKIMKVFKSKKSRKGFTLIELVIVIAIVGILATIVIPKFTSVAKDADDTANIASARTIASAVTLAIAEKEDYEDIEADDINKYLSNITVSLDQGGSDWYVELGSLSNNEEDFKIFLNGDVLFPGFESENN